MSSEQLRKNYILPSSHFFIFADPELYKVSNIYIADIPQHHVVETIIKVSPGCRRVLALFCQTLISQEAVTIGQCIWYCICEKTLQSIYSSLMLGLHLRCG